MVNPHKEIRSCRPIALTLVMSKWCATCIFLSIGQRRKNQKDRSACTLEALTVSVAGISRR